MSSELSTILDHIEKINELDARRRRADVPRRRDRERAAAGRAARELAARADDGARARRGRWRLPRSEPGRVSELGLLSAAQAAERVKAGEVSAAELWDLYRERAAARRSERVPVGGRGAGRRRMARSAAFPLAVKDLFCVEDVPSYAGSRDPRGVPAAVHGDERAEASRRGRARARQDQHGRVRDGLVERELGLRTGPEPVGPRARAGRLVRRVGRGGGGGHRAVGDRHRHRRLDPPARRAVRDRRAEAHLRRRLALRDDRVRLVARPGRAADARRDRRCAPLQPHGGPGPVRLDVARVPGGDPAPDGRAARRDPLRRAAGADRRGHRGRRQGRVRGEPEADRGPGRRARRGLAAARAAMASPPTT